MSGHAGSGADLTRPIPRSPSSQSSLVANTLSRLPNEQERVHGPNRTSESQLPLDTRALAQ